MKVITYNIRVDLMLHALGIDYTRNGKQVKPNTRYRPYPTICRNHYQTSDCKHWNLIVELGLANFVKGKESWQDFYYVTSDGKSYLKDKGYKFKESK